MDDIHDAHFPTVDLGEPNVDDTGPLGDGARSGAAGRKGDVYEALPSADHLDPAPRTAPSLDPRLPAVGTQVPTSADKNVVKPESTNACQS